MKKHEQIIVVCLAYIIGFTTAYIAFALSGKTSGDRAYYAALQERGGAGQAAVGSSRVNAMMTAEGLLVVKDGQERPLSAKIPADAEASADGFHYDDVAVMVSPDGQYVHYCAVISHDDTCSHLMYSVAEDKVYRMYDGAGPLVSSIAEAGAGQWLPDGRFAIGSKASADAAAPWAMQ